MQNAAGRPADEMATTIRHYSPLLYRVCFVILGHEHDVEDALQETFIRYMQKAPPFQDDEHKKAWLIKVATNVCRDILRVNRRHQHQPLTEVAAASEIPESSLILESVLALPLKYKVVILLYYAEGYKVAEIAQLAGISVAAVKKRLQRAREMLKIACGEEEPI